LTAWLALAAVAPADSTPSTPASAQGVVAQRCDGTRRTVSPTAAAKAKCSSWRVEWVKDGKVWGVTTAPDLKSLEERTDAMQGFARRDAKLFGRAVDDRFANPSPSICDQCASQRNLGRWGKGQTFSGLTASTELANVRKRYESLQTEVFDTHIPAIDDAARLTHYAKTKKQAAVYAKAIETAVVALGEHALALDVAETMLVQSDVEALAKQIDKTRTELEKARASLVGVVANSVASAHAGTYNQEGASQPAKLIVAFDGSKVTATYSVGGSTSTWFEGEVSLDGAVTGRSLMAPEKGELKCKDHTEACGYEYINSVLRFAVASDGKAQRAELWFQRSTWVQAPVFSR
jgi:hypothetical protein